MDETCGDLRFVDGGTNSGRRRKLIFRETPYLGNV